MSSASPMPALVSRLAGVASERVRTLHARVSMELRFRRLVADDTKNDIRVIGLRRSGNHGVIEWLLGQHPGDTLFLNESLPGARPSRTRQREWIWRPAQQKGGQQALIYSYEDQSVVSLTTQTDAKLRVKWVGGARGRYDVLVLRDPFNMLASRLAWKREPLGRLRHVLALWKTYAAEFIGDLDTLPYKVPVAFNAWVTDPAYRRALAARLGVPFTDDGRDRVSHLGGGSSFDGEALNGRASTMKVLERWQQYREDRDFRALVADPEVHDLSARIFGVLPGTESLL